MLISKEIIPGEKYVTRDYQEKTLENSLEKNEEIYSSDEWYPQETYTYKITCGRNDENIIVNFVDIQINPVQYSPGKSELCYVTGDVEIQVILSL